MTLQDCIKVARGESQRIPKPAGEERIVTARPLVPAAASSGITASQGAPSNASNSGCHGTKVPAAKQIMSNTGRDGVDLLWPRKRERLELQGRAPVVFWNLAAAPAAS